MPFGVSANDADAACSGVTDKSMMILGVDEDEDEDEGNKMKSVNQ